MFRNLPVCEFVPTQSQFVADGYCESFNGKLCDELSNGEIFGTLNETKIVAGRRQRHNSTVRPNSPLRH